MACATNLSRGLMSCNVTCAPSVRIVTACRNLRLATYRRFCT